MRAAVLLLLPLAACSTVESRRADPPALQQSTAKSLQDFQGCLAEKTAGENVQYLPRPNGGTLSAGSGPQHYVSWVVDTDDTGSERRVTVHTVGPEKKILEQVMVCL